MTATDRDGGVGIRAALPAVAARLPGFLPAQRWYGGKERAVERVEIADISASLETPARHFSGVVHAREFDELDGGTSTKWYAPGIGMVGDDALRAVKVELAIE